MGTNAHVLLCCSFTPSEGSSGEDLFDKLVERYVAPDDKDEDAIENRFMARVNLGSLEGWLSYIGEDYEDLDQDRWGATTEVEGDVVFSMMAGGGYANMPITEFAQLVSQLGGVAAGIASEFGCKCDLFVTANVW